MSSYTDYLEDAVLNHVFRNTALTSPTTVYIALFTAAPTDAGGGTEVTGGSYARQAISFGAPSAGVIANDVANLFTATGSAYSGDVVAIAIMDASTAGNMLAWDDITAAPMAENDSVNFAIGAVTVTQT